MRSRTSSASNVDPFPNRAAPRRTPDDPTWHEPPDDRQDGGGSRGAYGVPQYSRTMILAVWAAAALPMAALAWVVAPAVAGDAPSERRFFLTLLGALTVGLVWQAALVVILMVRERRNDPTWTNIRDRLWLRPPTTEKRRGGRLWWWIAAYGVGLAAIDMLLIGPGGPHDRDFGEFLSSAAGKATFHHAWWLYALVAFELAFNTFLGEEMLFRGVLLPRMRAAFGKLDWVVNSFLFGFYHLHEPWVIPNAILTGFVTAYPTRKYRSAWMGIAIHSIESVFFLAVLIPVVLA
jgi:membrane protease YdiL (CAAX protease family)